MNVAGLSAHPSAGYEKISMKTDLLAKETSPLRYVQGFQHNQAVIGEHLSLLVQFSYVLLCFTQRFAPLIKR